MKNLSALSELSILIVTWKGDELLKNCLESLRRACGEVPEIVVVDNANLGSTKALVAAYPNAHYIAAPENLGFAGGNNLGLPLCTRPYVLLLNNDTIVHEEPFTQLIQYLKSHPKVAVVQGKMKLPLQGDVLDACGFMLNGAGGVVSRFIYRPVGTDTPTRPVYAAKGACLLFKKSILNEITGPLFYDFFVSNGEETDFCYRVWMSGHEVHFVDTPPISHLSSQTIAKVNHYETASRSLANVFFTYATTLGIYGLLKILPGFFTYQSILFFRYLIGFRINDIRPFIKTFALCIKRTHLTLKTRAELQQNRKTSDRTILKNVLAHPTCRYYFMEMRGTLSSYIRAHAKELPEIF